MIKNHPAIFERFSAFLFSRVNNIQLKDLDMITGLFHSIFKAEAEAEAEVEGSCIKITPSLITHIIQDYQYFDYFMRLPVNVLHLLEFANEHQMKTIGHYLEGHKLVLRNWCAEFYVQILLWIHLIFLWL